MKREASLCGLLRVGEAAAQSRDETIKSGVGRVRSRQVTLVVLHIGKSSALETAEGNLAAGGMGEGVVGVIAMQMAEVQQVAEEVSEFS